MSTCITFAFYTHRLQRDAVVMGTLNCEGFYHGLTLCRSHVVSRFKWLNRRRRRQCVEALKKDFECLNSHEPGDPIAWMDPAPPQLNPNGPWKLPEYATGPCQEEKAEEILFSLPIVGGTGGPTYPYDWAK